jgi:hypothetical protein
VFVPADPFPAESPGASPAKSEEQRMQLSVDFKILCFGSLKLAFARLFRREK